MLKGLIIMNKIIATLNQMNSFSKKVILYGCTIVLIACIVSIMLISVNASFIHDPELHNIGTILLQKFTVVFAQVVIAALVMDWFQKMQDED